jgi:hypothetical protein
VTLALLPLDRFHRGMPRASLTLALLTRPFHRGMLRAALTLALIPPRFAQPGLKKSAHNSKP